MDGLWTETVDPDPKLPRLPSRLPPGTLLAGRFEIRSPLGSGGSGVVYAAYDRVLKLEVALKILRPDRCSPAGLARLKREVQVARRVESPRLLRIFDMQEADLFVFLVMELVRGESLRSRLKLGIPWTEALEIGEQILEGLKTLHSVGIVHRDVKPGNVLLGDDGQVKLGDFGLAILEGGDLSRVTQTDAVIGTLDYLSPEQALGKKLDARSDLYSFGVLLFELLSGRLPFQRDSSLGSLVARLHEPPRDLRSIAPQVPAWLCEIVDRLLEKSPENRYQTAADVLSDLKVGAARIGSVRRKIGRRRRILKVIGMAAGAAVIGLGSYALWLSRRFDHLIASGKGGTRAVDRRGRTLWTLPDLDLVHHGALVRTTAGGRLFAGIRAAPAETDVEKLRDLAFFDLQTGAVIRTVKLPTSPFRGYSPRFSLDSVEAVDLDGDGVDEVIATYVHLPEAPSFSVLFDPVREQAKIVFMATGHHRFVFAQDVDGDGLKKLVFFGINNAFGWYNAVAIVRAVRWDSPSHSGVSSVFGPGASPDLDTVLNSDATVDYVLLPRGPAALEGRNVSWDERGSIRISYFNGKTVFVDPAGCGLESRLEGGRCAERRAARYRAYGHLRELIRSANSGLFTSAIRESEASMEDAKAASDTILEECILRLRSDAFIQSGDTSAAEKILGGLWSTSENAPEIANNAAVAYHLRGDLARAVDWYWRAIRGGGAAAIGRSKAHSLTGLLLALGEMERWDQAKDVMDRYESFYSGDARLWRQVIAWRTTGRAEAVPVHSLNTDSWRYWGLELRAAAGEDPAAVARAVAAEYPELSHPAGLFKSLEAEMLERSGRSAEALVKAEEAWRETRLEREKDIFARAHFDLVTERWARMAEKAGKRAEAAEARRFLKEVWWRPTKR